MEDLDLGNWNIHVYIFLFFCFFFFRKLEYGKTKIAILFGKSGILRG